VPSGQHEAAGWQISQSTLAKIMQDQVCSHRTAYRILVRPRHHLRSMERSRTDRDPYAFTTLQYGYVTVYMFAAVVPTTGRNRVNATIAESIPTYRDSKTRC